MSYLEEGVPWFVDVTDESKLAIEPKQVENGQPITDSENEKIKKRLKCIAKRKTWRNNFRALVQALAAGSATFSLSHPGISTLLLSCSMPALLSRSVPAASLSCSRSSTPLSSRLVPALLSHFVSTALSSVRTLAARLLLSTPVSCTRTLTTLLFHLVLSPTLTHLTFLALRTYNQVLSNESLHC